MLRFTPSKFDASQDEDISAFITPPGKGDYSDGDTPSQMDAIFPTSLTLDGSYTETTRRPLGRFFSFDVKRSLFSTAKRLADDDDDADDLSPVTKKLREAEAGLKTFVLESPEPTPTSEQHVRTVVNRLSTEADLIADGSRQCTLPTIPGRHSDLKSISIDTMSDVLSSCYDDTIDHVTIIDCRYPYEFEGGHIEGAINLYTRDGIQSFLTQHSLATTSGSHVLIFHCEFSSERGPKMCRFLRNQDRKLNKDNYPALNFPEVYLLHGGYQAFFDAHKTQCEPPTYKPMLHNDHADDLRRFRVKSKSWSAGEKSRVSRVTQLRF